MFIPRQVQCRTSTIKAKRCLPSQPDERQEQRPSKKQRLDGTSKLSTTKTTASITAADTEHKVYYEEILCGLELLLSDYAYTEPGSKKWLLERERQVEGGGYTHLSAFLDSPVFVRSNPPVTQTSLQRALEFCKSELLELSSDRYHVRRICAPQPAGSSVNWDAQTIYVEPHLSSLALSPPKLIHHLLSCHHTPRSILPVQHVHVGKRPSYAFLTLSAPVHGIGTHCWPTDWIVLTKAQWKKRDAEYQALRFAESRPSYYSIDSKNARQLRLTTPAGPSQTKAQPLPTRRDYPTGRLVYLTGLHPAATKASIAALISHHVDKYFRRLCRAQKQQGLILQDPLAYPVPSASILTLDITSLKIMYTDYTPGTTTATIRLASTTDADKVITALAAHHLFHTPNDSRSSSVCDKVGDGQANAVTGELVTGGRERIYWEECVWKGKRGKKAKERNYWDKSRRACVR